MFRKKYNFAVEQRFILNFTILSYNFNKPQEDSFKTPCN